MCSGGENMFILTKDRPIFSDLEHVSDLVIFSFYNYATICFVNLFTHKKGSILSNSFVDRW